MVLFFTQMNFKQNQNILKNMTLSKFEQKVLKSIQNTEAMPGRKKGVFERNNGDL